MTPSAKDNDSSGWLTLCATVVSGHQVASGNNGNPCFPGGTIRMQAPHFLARGIDITAYYPGTINASIAPLRYRPVNAAIFLPNVRWHPTEPAEDFSFFDVQVVIGRRPPVVGYIYYPHPETKPAHFQQPDVLELLIPYLEGIEYGAKMVLKVRSGQISIQQPVSPAQTSNDG